MPKKNALIDRRMTSDRAGLNCELYGLDFGHCELLSKSVCAHCDQTAFIDKCIDLQQQIFIDRLSTIVKFHFYFFIILVLIFEIYKMCKIYGC